MSSLVAVSVLCASAVFAQISTSTTATGPNGNTAMRTATRQDGQTNVTETGPNGNTASRNVSGRSTGDVNATTTGPNGNTASRSTSRYAGAARAQ